MSLIVHASNQKIQTYLPDQYLNDRGEGELKDLQMDTMITKWEIMKIGEDPPPPPTQCHVLSGFDHQKTYYTHPICCNFHCISLYTKWFWS